MIKRQFTEAERAALGLIVDQRTFQAALLALRAAEGDAELRAWQRTTDDDRAAAHDRAAVAYDLACIALPGTLSCLRRRLKHHPDIWVLRNDARNWGTNMLSDIANHCLRLPEQVLPFIVVGDRLAQPEQNGPEHPAVAA